MLVKIRQSSKLYFGSNFIKNACQLQAAKMGTKVETPAVLDDKYGLIHCD